MIRSARRQRDANRGFDGGDAETAEDDASSETVQATEPEDAKETVSGTS